MRTRGAAFWTMNCDRSRIVIKRHDGKVGVVAKRAFAGVIRRHTVQRGAAMGVRY